MTNHDILDHRLKAMENKVDRIDENVSKISSALTDFIVEVRTQYLTEKTAENKFASKISEKIVFGMVGIILTSVLGGILALILTR